MACLAVSNVPRLEASDDELSADGPSYTAETLERLRAPAWNRSPLSPSQIFFITGVDAFADIATWKRYPEVLDLANFVVVARPGHALDGLRSKLPSLTDRMRPASAAGDSGGTTSIYLLPASTPDVSSTGVRDRLRHGQAITGLVPPLVETHIIQHALYSTTRRISEGVARTDAPADTQANESHGQNRENRKETTGGYGEVRRTRQTADRRDPEGCRLRAGQEGDGRRGARSARDAGVHRFLRALFGSEPAPGARDRRRRRGGAAGREGAAESRRGLRPGRVGPDGLLHVHRAHLHAADARLLLARAALGRRRANRGVRRTKVSSSRGWSDSRATPPTPRWRSCSRPSARRAANRSMNPHAAPSVSPDGVQSSRSRRPAAAPAEIRCRHGVLVPSPCSRTTLNSTFDRTLPTIAAAAAFERRR